LAKNFSLFLPVIGSFAAIKEDKKGGHKFFFYFICRFLVAAFGRGLGGAKISH